MKALVDIDESLLRLASELTGKSEKSELVNMGLRALIKKQPADDGTGKELSKPVVQTDPSPVSESVPRRRTLGGWEDIWIAEDFDETPEDFLKYFTGEES